MGRIGLALPALLLIFASTVTSDFPDIYSSACSLVNILPRVKPTHTMWGTGLLTIVLALFFDLSRYEDFLIMIGAVFVPLFTVLLVEFFGFRCRGLGELDFRSGRGLEFRGGYRISGMAAWLGGTAAFFAASRTGFVLGGSLTAILVAGLLYALARRGLEPTAEAAAPGPVPRA
jgi:purine-cytosine permease-like protein